MKTHILSLSRDLLTDRYAVCLKTDGYSMYPLFRPGDTIYIEHVPFHALPPASIVVFQREDRWIAHRLIRRDERQGSPVMITQGDSCIKPDEDITGTTYVGRVMVRKRAGHTLTLGEPGLYGRFIVASLPWPHYLLHALVKVLRKWRRIIRVVHQRLFR